MEVFGELTVTIGMGVCYEGIDSPRVTTSHLGIWKAGSRCPPDVELVTTPGGKKTRLYSEVTYGKYIVISVGKQQAMSSLFGELTVMFIDVHPHSPQSVQVSNLSPLQDLLGSSSNVCKQAKQFTGTWVSDDDSFMVLVRPDMYIAFAGSDVASCECSLRAWLLEQ